MLTTKVDNKEWPERFRNAKSKTVKGFSISAVNQDLVQNDVSSAVNHSPDLAPGMIDALRAAFDEPQINEAILGIEKKLDHLFSIQSLFRRMQLSVPVVVDQEALLRDIDTRRGREALLDLQSWWGRIRSLKTRGRLNHMIAISLDLPHDILSFIKLHEIRAYNATTTEGVTISHALHSRHTLEGLVFVVKQIQDQARHGVIIIDDLTVSLNDLDEMGYARLLLLLHAHAFLQFVRETFRCFNKSIDLPRWEVSMRNGIHH